MTSQVSSPGVVTCWPSAIVWGTATRDALARAQRARHVVAGLGLDADHARVRRQRLDRRGHARRSARRRRPGRPPRRGRRRSAASSSADGALAGHHERLVVGVHEREPALGGERAGERLAVVGVAVELDDLGAVALGGGALGRRARRVGMRIVARAPCSRAARASAWAWLPEETEQTPSGRSAATALNAPRNLKAPARWRFSALSATGRRPRVERARAQQRRAVGDAVDARGRRVHVVDRDRQRRGASRREPRAPGARAGPRAASRRSHSRWCA